MKKDFLTLDPWLTGILKKDSYHLNLNAEETFIFLQNHDSSESKQLSLLKTKDCFIDCKVSPHMLKQVHFLENQCFHLIDTQLQFKKKISTDRGQGVLHSIDPSFCVRFSQPSDEAQVVTLSKNLLKLGRFHSDPSISRETADFIKSEWISNFYRKIRGDSMIVCESENKILGFLLMLHSAPPQEKETWTMDLMALHPDFRGKNLGKALIAFAEQMAPSHIHYLMLGTQLINERSLVFYEMNQFRLMGSQYIFHFHGRP